MENRVVLFMDHQLALMQNLSEILRLMGHKVSLAFSGEQGLKAIKDDNGSDVVELDFRAPGLSEMEVLREIKPALKTSREVIILGGFQPTGSGSRPL